MAAGSPPPLEATVVANDAALAAALASGAGEALLSLRNSFRLDGDATALKDAGDQLGHQFLMTALGAYRPGDVVLSEEGRDNPARLQADRVWIVDPLDGTREFSEPPRDDWAIHVALWEHTTGATAGVGSLTAAAVALPARGITASTADGRQPGERAQGARLRIVVSRTRPPLEAERVASELDAELVPMGSAGAKVMAVVLGDADAYVHSGGQYEWDSAAPVAVAQAAGFHCSRIDGSALIYNQPNVSLPDLIVCRPELATAVVAAAGATTE